IANARDELEIATYVFSNKEIADAVIDSIERGADVKIIFDSYNAKKDYSLDEVLMKKGAKVKFLGGSVKMHNKFIIIDQNSVITGSFNFSNAANRNYENVVFLNCSNAAKEFKHYFYSLWQRGREAS
ncbi:MAG: DUF1669 domain-containing protein, partial [Candidatus Diapherotrites archaeon]|nr:DUF1669 domain-containing protein [Candidatus Diapherotrites archaeon]